MKDEDVLQELNKNRFTHELTTPLTALMSCNKKVNCKEHTYIRSYFYFLRVVKPKATGVYAVLLLLYLTCFVLLLLFRTTPPSPAAKRVSSKITPEIEEEMKRFVN